MEQEDWLARWREGRTGWHQGEVTPLLLQHWAALRVPAGARVLVPLCGKTLDLKWLAGQGHEVLGVELSELAVQQFFAESGLQPARRPAAYGVHYRAGSVEVIVGNVFGVPAPVLASCAAIYDRAALIALPPSQRRRYAHEVYGRLPSGSPGLLISLEYARDRMAGPPFSVLEAEVRELFEPQWSVTLAVRRDTTGPQRAEAGAGFSAAAYRLERR